MKPTIQTLKDTVGIGLGFVWHYVLLLLVGSTIIALFTAWAAVSWLGMDFFSVFAFMGMCAGLILLAFILTSAHSVSNWVGDEIAEIIAWSEAERGRLFPPTPTTPELSNPTPPAINTYAQPKKYHDFDERDLAALCISFSMGAKWSEKYLMNKPLPTTGEILDKARYYQLMDEVFVRAGIIGGGRGGPGNYTGRLLISDPDAMMTAIRNLPPAPPADIIQK